MSYFAKLVHRMTGLRRGQRFRIKDNKIAIFDLTTEKLIYVAVPGESLTILDIDVFEENVIVRLCGVVGVCSLFSFPKFREFESKFEKETYV